MLLIWAFDASVTRLIQLYIIGVFTSFTLGQLGHGPALEPGAAHRARPAGSGAGSHRSRAINAIGGAFTGLVLVIVLVTKFTARRLDLWSSRCR